MEEGISPSTYMIGAIQITQGWPEYLSGEPHSGIDIACGLHPNDLSVAVEDSEIIEIREGTVDKSGMVKMIGNMTGITVVHKHIGEFRVKVGDMVRAGDIIGKPNFTNTKEKHLHFETWDGKKNVNPVEYLLKVQPFLIYIHSEKKENLSYKTDKWYAEKYPELYERMRKDV